MGFYEENRIKKDDKLTLDGKKATEDDKQCRFSKNSELSTFLHMTHPQLPEKMAQIFGSKLKNQDLASLQEQILDRCQSVLDELEGTHTAVNRINHHYGPSKHNSNTNRHRYSDAPRPQNSRQTQAFLPRQAQEQQGQEGQ